MRNPCPRFTIREVMLLTAVFAVFTAINVSGRSGVIGTAGASSHGTFYEIELEGKVYGWPLPFYATQNGSETCDYFALHLISNITVAIATGVLSIVALRTVVYVRAVPATSILQMLVVALGVAGQAGAADIETQYEAVPIIEVPLPPTSDYTVELNWKLYGFREWAFNDGINENRTIICFGSLGSCHVPITATQGLIGFCFVLVMLIIVPAMLALRWKKKPAAP